MSLPLKLRTVLASYALCALLSLGLAAGGLLEACYDPKSPNLPPCEGTTSSWPDPCAYATLDASSEASPPQRKRP